MATLPPPCDDVPGIRRELVDAEAREAIQALFEPESGG
jgi:hypothetical protein